MRTLIYIVIDSRMDDGINYGYHIDSVWTSKRKADKRCNKLNKQLEDNPVWGLGLYEVQQKFVQTQI
ncbi:hypothetical protein bpr_II191 (plasmid) [Butyrivibrio proteoclasticus B316]|uniref:Uncharacterized protein n=1 Tax=Butyrivibrio proteoclasticus (strain ATCC 51982 / DSM 14932 / B316) TaxID=515622 RepID=E0S3Z7_BUTPB|nr:hypothetical protein bpr_II191 [Butyrivibrio proteoclasticus B316]